MFSHALIRWRHINYVRYDTEKIFYDHLIIRKVSKRETILLMCEYNVYKFAKRKYVSRNISPANLHNKSYSNQ